jgi:muramoyltetrapeptide carboxypeptidase
LEWASEEESEARFFLSGSDLHRAKWLKSLLESPKVENILCTRGGYGTLRLLPHLNKMKIRAQGTKRIWGYSDTTIIQMYLYERFGWSWVHAPMLCSQSWQEPDSKERHSMRNLFLHEGWAYKKTLKLLSSSETKFNLKEAPLIGGNLMSLVSMLSGPWIKKQKQPYLLFLEDINEAHYRLDRLLVILSQSAFFKNCAGIVLGHFTDCPGYQKLFKLWAKETGVALFSKIEAGHESPNLPLIMGEKVQLKKINSLDYEVCFPTISLERRRLK